MNRPSRTDNQAYKSRLAWSLLALLGALGLLDTALRYLYLPDRAIALRDIVNDPGKQLFVVVFVPLLAFLLARHYPLAQARVAIQRHRRLFLALAIVLPFGVGYAVVQNAVKNFYVNCTTPEHIRLDTLRTNITLMRETNFQAVVNAWTQSNYAAVAEEQMRLFETNRNAAFASKGLTNASVKGFWRDASPHAKVAVVETAAAALTGLAIVWTMLLFTFKGSQKKPETTLPKETSDAILLAVALLSLWPPLKLYSEWYTNFCHAREGQHLSALTNALLGLFVLLVVTLIVKASDPVRGWICKAIVMLGILVPTILTFPEANDTLNTVARSLYVRLGNSDVAPVVACGIIVLLVAFVLGFSNLIPSGTDSSTEPDHASADSAPPARKQRKST